MSSKFCGPDIIKFFTVQPPPEKFPIILSGSSGCVIDNITVDVDGAFELPDTTVTDNFDNSFNMPAVQNLLISSSTSPIINFGNVNDCDYRIDIEPCSDPFPILLSGSSGCVIDTITTDPNGAFELPDTNLDDSFGNSFTIPAANDITIIGQVPISNILPSDNPCGFRILLQDVFPIDLVNRFGCLIDTIETNPSGSFSLPATTINDDSGNFGTAFLGNTINIVNGTIDNITTTDTGCTTNIILDPCPNPFPIILSGSSGCVIDTIETNPNGAFELPNITVVDGDSFSASTSSPNNIIVSGASISSINPDGCDLTINITSSGPTNIIPNRVIPNFSSVIDYTGDLAWQWNNGTYDYNDGSGIKQELDPTAGVEYFFRLKYNNQFGNQFRFTDDQGVPAPLGRYDFPIDITTPNSVGATPGYFVDNLTGLGWTHQPVAGAKGFVDSLNLCNTLIVNTYGTFRMPSDIEMLSLAFNETLNNNVIDANSPFNRGGSVPGQSFDPTSGGQVTNSWVNRIVSGQGRVLFGSFRLRITDFAIGTTTGLGTYAVRTHF